MAGAAPKPWKAEYAKSARASCKTCKSNIGKETLRLGRMVVATQFDGFMPMWHHANCIFKKPKQIKSIEDVEGIDLMRWEDQQRIRKYVEDGSTNTSVDASPGEIAIEVSPNARASCKHCGKKIDKGSVRLSFKSSKPGNKSLGWHHLECFFELFPTTQFTKLSGWDSLSEEDKEHIGSWVKEKKNGAEKKRENAFQEGNEIQEQNRKGSKRKNVASDGKSSKMARSEPNISSPNPSPSGLDRKLEEQSKALWAVKDEIKKHVTTAEMREMLDVNEQNSTGSEFDLRDRCADGMLFGALGRCPICSGFLHYSGGKYLCHGYVSAWSKCSYSTTEPVRLKGKWKIPDETENKYLVKWYKSQNVKKPERVLPPLVLKAIENDAAVSDKKFEDLMIALYGLEKDSMNEWKNKIEGAGGTIHPNVKKDTFCLVVGEDVGNEVSEIKKARRMKVPIVREGYLVDCFSRQKILPVDQYKVESVAEPSGGTLKVKVKGQSAVHEASGLQDTCHILQDQTAIYNTTLNMSDLSTGINSYYILQIIEEDRGGDCYVFRKWGRVGNDKIGGTKLEELPEEDAIEEFKRLFREKTGNSWEAWETKQNFQKQPGRFFPLEIVIFHECPSMCIMSYLFLFLIFFFFLKDYGVKNQAIKKKDYDISASRLSRPLLELVKMLFDVETYRAAMMEFEINLSEMPLGKLSKSNIQKGFEALTEIENLLKSSNIDQSMKDSLIVDASNRFFTVIPSIHPHIIRDEDDFKSKVKMLEALQDIEIAAKLADFDNEDEGSLDDKYEKLRCDISPLPRDGEDFRLVEKYLMTTHAPTHKEWSLELEEVFSLEREGELDKFASYREKIGNRMLLWHGSRLSNFVGILSQGLRIAPPEAPSTGYMFGKGIYFADLVSKSAQYCYTDKKSPVGLLLLSEVALGQVHELKNAMYMDKPPEGKHSTKGLGKHIPKKSEYVQWRDAVTVPCGSPMASSVRTSELMYNEYIVYNTAQVKMQFLVKVRFHHKR